MMKTILVPTLNNPAMKSTLETALLLARRAPISRAFHCGLAVLSLSWRSRPAAFPWKSIERGAKKERRERR